MMKCKSKCLNGSPCQNSAVFGPYCIKHYEMLRRGKKSFGFGYKKK